VRDIGFSTFKQLIGGLLQDQYNKHPIENIANCTYYISLEVLWQICFIQ